MSVIEKVKAIESKIIEHRRWLHQNPELGMNVDKTAAYVKEKLTQMGYEPYEVGKNGIVADLTVDKNKKTIMLRADMDALPVEEKSGLPYAAKGPNMHACGHDLHTASLLGAAEVLIGMKTELSGNVKFMFQPAEETIEGAKAMIDAGLLTTGLIPDISYSSHVISAMPTGVVMMGQGPFFASSDIFTVHITGSGGHGSTPETAIDPITIGMHIGLGYQEIIAREKGISQEAILTIGAFNSGHVANVIPETATLKGTLRTYDEDVRANILKRLSEIAESIAVAYRGKARVEILSGTPSLYADPEMVDKVAAIIGKISPEKIHQVVSQDKLAGSEDYAYVSREMPSVMALVGAQSPEIAKPFPQHHEQVTFDENALLIGAAAYVQVSKDIFAD